MGVFNCERTCGFVAITGNHSAYQPGIIRTDGACMGEFSCRYFDMFEVMCWLISSSDLIADMAVARRGFANMGIGAAFGGPIFSTY